jgi:putative membrane protein
VCGWGWGWGGNGWGWGGTVMTIVLAGFLVAVIVAVVFAIRDLARGGSQYNGASSAATGPEDALAQRFARGEIDEDGYRRRIALLREHV